VVGVLLAAARARVILRARVLLADQHADAGPTTPPTITNTPRHGNSDCHADASVLSPNGLAVDSETHLVYVTSKDNNRLFVMDGVSLNVVDNVGVGSRPFGVAVNSRHRVYVANWGTNDVTVLDATTHAFRIASTWGPARPSRRSTTADEPIYTVKYGGNALVSLMETTDAIENQASDRRRGCMGSCSHPNLNPVTSACDSGT